MHPDHFLDFVRQEFAPLIEKYGLRELASISVPVYKRITFTNDERAVLFDLDSRDGYFDPVYSDASVYKPDGNLAEPAIESWNRRRSLSRLLKSEGISWPEGKAELFKSGVLETAVRDAIAGIERHSKEVLGR